MERGRAHPAVVGIHEDVDLIQAVEGGGDEVTQGHGVAGVHEGPLTTGQRFEVLGHALLAALPGAPALPVLLPTHGLRADQDLHQPLVVLHLHCPHPSPQAGHVPASGRAPVMIH